MGADHDHGSPGTAARGVTRLLAVVVLAATAATLAGLLLLRPDGDVVRDSQVSSPYAGLQVVGGTVVDLRRAPCETVPGLTGTAPADDASGLDASADCAWAGVDVESAGGGTERTLVPVPVELADAGLGSGDRLRLARYPDVAGGEVAYAFVGYDRGLPLGVLAAAFALVVVAVARWKGVAALAGLGIAFAVIGAFLLPALRTGAPALPLALVTASAIMIPVLYLAHGVSARTSTALVGTLLGLALTAGLAAWATGAARLDGLVADEDFELNRLTSGAGLSGVVLCGVVVAGLGVLNDVTITQSSAVWELRRRAPHLNARELFASGMRIGRDHLASTVYTIVFAYTGAALPTLLLLDLYGQPLSVVLSGGDVAEEVVRTLVGSIGLVLTIPLTTALAAVVAASGRGPRPTAVPAAVADEEPAVAVP